MSRLRHTAYVLSSRMSTPALGWSRLGAFKMARLREWSYNKETMEMCIRDRHNIFKSSSKECDRKYPEGLLKKLGHDSSFRINRKTPLLLLLSLVDTIECVKKFGKKDQEDNGNKSFEALTVLKSIFVFSDKEKIEIDLSEFAKKMKKKGIDKEEYWKSISTLSNWTELKVTEKDDVFTIVLE